MKPLAIITGASSGIGRAFAQLLAKEDVDLLLVARSEDALQQLRSELQKVNHNTIELLPLDLTTDFTARFKTQLAGRPVKYLINNAGFGDFGAFSKCDIDTQERMIDLNIKALTVLTKLFLEANEAVTDDCYLLNVASIAAYLPGPLMSVYYATKAYVLSFTEAVQFEERFNKHLHISALCPGPTRTGFILRLQNGLSMSPEDVAAYGFPRLRDGKRVIVPGLMNRFTLGIVTRRLLPKHLIRWLTERVMKMKQ